MREVILVCGPPCAGKTTYVEQHAQPGDLILDQDVLGYTAMEAALDELASMTEGRAWVIRCAPGAETRGALSARVAGTRTIVLKPDNRELYARAKRRPKGAWMAIREWLDIEAGKRQPRREAGRQHSDPTPRSRTKW